jgi:photosystem II stability/assembly factor-like uncharacterized protein
MPSEDRILLAAGPHQIYKSIDGGGIWKPLSVRLILPPLPEPVKQTPTRPAARGKKTVIRKAARPVERIREVAPSEISELSAVKSGTKDVLFAATGLGLLESSDSGEHWKLAEMPAATAVTALYGAPNSDGRLIARTSAGLFLSKDFGDHWVQLSFPLPSWDVNDIAIPTDDNAPLLIATRVGLYSSPDGGSKWYANAGGMPASTVSSVLYSRADRMAYAVEYGRLYESRDEGSSWKVAPSGLPATRIRKLWMPDAALKRLYGITNDLGVLFRN